jgi:hypothetical protein
MKAPSGFTHTRTSAKNSRICKIPPLVIGFSLELLWPEKRVKQVDEQTERSDAGNDIVHGFFLLELVAGLGEGPADNQEQATDCKVEQVEHEAFLSQSFSVTTTS